MRVVVGRQVIATFDEIDEYYTGHGRPDLADRYVDAVDVAMRRLAKYHQHRRTSDDLPRRFRRTLAGYYVIYYEVDEAAQTVYVYEVRHGARKPLTPTTHLRRASKARRDNVELTLSFGVQPTFNDERIPAMTATRTREDTDSICTPTVTPQVAVDMGNGVDWGAVKQDFPILQRSINGKRVVYLDSTASAQKPNAVIEAVRSFYRTSNANIHRGAYTFSEEATAAYEAARGKVAQFINAPDQREVIFTRNATEGLNLVAYAWGRQHIKAGDVIVVTEMEHHSNLIPWQILAKEKDAQLEFIPFDGETGELRLEVLDNLLTPRLKLLSMVHVSNTLGTINPVAEVARRAHAVGAVVVIDAAQSVPHMPVDVQELGCDFLAFSGHKMCAPSGIGGLWGRLELLDAMPPFMAGGGTVARVGLRDCDWAEVPGKFEAGTPAFGEAVGMGAAVDYLSAIGMANIRAHEVALASYAMQRFAEVPGLSVYGSKDMNKRGATFPFNLAAYEADDIALRLDEDNIHVRAGRHCSQPIMDRLGVCATARASFYLYNLADDVDALVEALQRAA